MSAPLKLTAEQLEDIANALRELSEIRRDDSVEIGGYGEMQIRHIEADVVLTLAWDKDADEYRIDDRSGS